MIVSDFPQNLRCGAVCNGHWGGRCALRLRWHGL